MGEICIEEIDQSGRHVLPSSLVFTYQTVGFAFLLIEQDMFKSFVGEAI